MRLAENAGSKNDAKNRHLRNIAQICHAVSSQLRHISTIGKKLLNSNMSSTCPRNMANFGPLTAEIRWRVWGTSANFNGFRVLLSLLQRRRLPDANQTLYDVWPSPVLLHYIYIFGGSCPLADFCRCKIHFTSKCCVLVYWQRYCTALQQRSSAKLCGVVQEMEFPNFDRGRHLYSAGRPSRWASAHFLVLFSSPNQSGRRLDVYHTSTHGVALPGI